MNTEQSDHQLYVAKWSAIIRECQSSGMMVKDYLERNGIPKSRYYYWVRTIKHELQQKGFQNPDSDTPVFAELPVPVNTMYEKIEDNPEVDTPLPSACISHKETRIEVFETASASFIKRLLEAMTC